ncbi:MAG: bifunctional UDP-sugar hydrolase/5'-nucleotidase [Myxococcota bacterium]
MWFLLACRPSLPPQPPAPKVLHLAAINDFHGGLYEAAVKGDDAHRYGGLPWLVAAVRSLRAAHPDLVLLDGGDEFQGSWPVNATHGRGSVEAFELLGVDATAVGNHEFDYGGLEGGHPLRGALEAAAASADYPFLTANVTTADGARWAPPNVLPWTVLERDGLRIGVVGLSTATTPTVTNPKNVADLRFGDVVDAVNALLPELDAADLDVRILVGHLTGSCEPAAYTRNDDPCTPDGEIGRLLTELPPGTFDVMVLGHAHTALHHRVGDTFLLENRSQGHLVGRLELVVGPDGVDPDASRIGDPWALAHDPADPGCEDASFPMDARDVGGVELAPDPEALALVRRLEAEVGSLCDELTCAARPLFRKYDGESELGDWLTDAMLAAYPDAQVAVVNSGGIRADLPEGKVRREQLQRVMPFDNRVQVVALTGAQLRTMFRLGSSGAHGVLQVAGASYAFDPARRGGSDLDGDGEVEPFEQDRLCRVEVAGAPVDDAATYQVVLSDFLVSGGDDLGAAFADARVVEEGPLLRELFYDAAARSTGCVGAAPAPEPRITTGPCR